MHIASRQYETPVFDIILTGDEVNTILISNESGTGTCEDWTTDEIIPCI